MVTESEELGLITRRVVVGEDMMRDVVVEKECWGGWGVANHDRGCG